jgi:hypothetical protein
MYTKNVANIFIKDEKEWRNEMGNESYGKHCERKRFYGVRGTDVIYTTFDR